jgi:hypothetical protein
MAISIPEFPNLFMLNGPNGPVGNFSLIEVAELQFHYIMQLVQEITSGQCRAVSVTQEAADRFEAERTEAARNTVWVTGCRSWYLDDRGIPAAWPWTFDRFREVMDKPVLTDFELVCASSPGTFTGCAGQISVTTSHGVSPRRHGRSRAATMPPANDRPSGTTSGGAGASRVAGSAISRSTSTTAWWRIST